MFFKLFNWFVKRLPYGLALMIFSLIWSEIMIIFVAWFVVARANLEITRTTEVVIYSYFLVGFIVFLFCIMEYGYGISTYGKGFKILNDNIINGHIKSDIPDQSLLEVYDSISKINRWILTRHIQYAYGVATTVALIELVVSRSFINFPIIWITGLIWGSVAIITGIAYDLFTLSARRECKLLLDSRGISFKEPYFLSLKIKSNFFIILTALSSGLILIIVHPLTLNIVIASIITIITITILTKLVFETIYKALLEVKELAYNLEKGKKTSFFTGSLDKEIVDLSKSLNKTANEIYSNKIQLEEERNKTLAIINNFADGLIVLDNKNIISLVNSQAEVFFSVKEKNLIGKNISEIASISLELNKNYKILREEFKINEDLILEISALPVMKEKEKIGTLIIFHDITREKRIEEMKTEFVSLAAHQLRTPLSGIKWALKLILDGDLGKITKEQKKFFKGIFKSNEKLIWLINDLLNVSAIEEGRYIYKKNLVNIEQLISSVIRSYQREIQNKKIKLKFEKPKEKLPKIILDSEKINLAINSLLENALTYTEINGKIIISLKKKEKEIEFSIEDTGVGIPQNQQKRVFSKFFRASNVVKIDTEGTGLGLFITKNIIEAHNGRIWFESKEGQGSKFSFSLPY